MSADLKLFGDRLRQLRQQRGLTQAELALQLPVSEGLISARERAYQGQGRVWKPDRQMFLRLLELFGEGLDAAGAQALGVLVGYTLTRAELQSLFPSLQLATQGNGQRTKSQAPFAEMSQVDEAEGQDSFTDGLAAGSFLSIQEPFVGREEELARLQGYLTEMLAGQGRVVFVNGAAGSGKSLLVRAFAQNALVEHPHLIVLDGNCSAYGGYGTPYMPFRELLRVLLGDATTKWAAGSIRRLQQKRLLRLAPYTLQLLANPCRDLIESFVPATTLMERARALHANHAISQDQLRLYLTAIKWRFPDRIMSSVISLNR